MKLINLLGLNVRLDDSVKTVDNSLPIALKLPKSILSIFMRDEKTIFSFLTSTGNRRLSKQDKGWERGDRDRHTESSRNRDTLRDRDSGRDRSYDKERSRNKGKEYVQVQREM